MADHRFDTVLLISAEPFARRTLAATLRAAGVRRVLDAATAAEALTILGSELVPLVLTPWELPDDAGRPLLEALRDHGRNRNVPVVLLDSGLPRASVVAAVKAGAAARLALPADVPGVRDLLERVAADAAASEGAEAEAPHSGGRRNLSRTPVER